MNWDKPLTKEEYEGYMLDKLYKIKEYHGYGNLTWWKITQIDPEFDLATNWNHKQYLELCKTRNTKLYRVLK